MNRFDLEQQIMNTWNVIEDIRLLAKQQADVESFSALATVYEHKFTELWDTFEAVCVAATQCKADSAPTAGSSIQKGIREVTFKDDDSREVRMSYGRYDGELILGIDASPETLSLRIDDLETLIPSLRFLNKAAK